MSGGGGSTKTVQNNDPYKGLQPYLIGGKRFDRTAGKKGGFTGPEVSGIYDRAYDLSMQPFEYYPGQTYADLTPAQYRGVNEQIAAAGEMGGLANELASSTDFLLNAADINNNPALDSQYAALNRQLEDQWGLTKSALSDQAMAAGQFGMDNHAVAQGVARADLDEAALNAKAGLMANAYNQGLDAQTKAMGLAPTAMQAQLMPGQARKAAADIYQRQHQLGLNEDMARYAFNQQAPWDQVSRLNDILQGGMRFGTTSSSGTSPGGSPIAGALGGAAAGAGAYSALGPAGSALLGTGWGAPLAIGGAVLGGLFSK